MTAGEVGLSLYMPVHQTCLSALRTVGLRFQRHCGSGERSVLYPLTGLLASAALAAWRISGLPLLEKLPCGETGVV